MQRGELLKSARNCMRSVELYYLKQPVPVLLAVSLPRRMIAVDLPIELNGATRVVSRRLTAAYDVLMTRKTARIHPQLAVDRAPRYVVLNVVYWACRDFLTASGALPHDPVGLAEPPQLERCAAWLKRHDYPPLGG